MGIVPFVPKFLVIDRLTSAIWHEKRDMCILKNQFPRVIEVLQRKKELG